MALITIRFNSTLFTLNEDDTVDQLHRIIGGRGRYSILKPTPKSILTEEQIIEEAEYIRYQPSKPRGPGRVVKLDKGHYLTHSELYESPATFAVDPKRTLMYDPMVVQQYYVGKYATVGFLFNGCSVVLYRYKGMTRKIKLVSRTINQGRLSTTIEYRMGRKLGPTKFPIISYGVESGYGDQKLEFLSAFCALAYMRLKHITKNPNGLSTEKYNMKEFGMDVGRRRYNK